MTNKKKKKFEKVVEWKDVDGEPINKGELMDIFFLGTLFFIIYVVSSPIWSVFQFFGDFGIKREVYWREKE